MGIKVAKFGGTSLADAAQFRKVKSIIDLDKDRRFIVNSAPGKRFSEDIKVTDMLYQCKRNLSDEQLFQASMEKVFQRFSEIIDQLGVDLDLEPILKEIEEKIREGASDDYTASRGEYLNGRIMAVYLGYDFVDPSEIIKFTPDKKLDPEKTYALATARLKDCKAAVIPGFYGSDAAGEIVTFSRGGSDITGAIVAKAVQADVYENWTDVSGMLAADPRIVKDPKPIAMISYKELRELASMGASVLHEDAVYPAKEAGIPINIRNTNRPEDPGTYVDKNIAPGASSDEPAGIAGKKGFSFLHISGGNVDSRADRMETLFSILAPLNLQVKSVKCNADMISVLVQGDMTEEQVEDTQRKIADDFGAEKVKWNNNIALIAVVGDGLNKESALAKTATALSKAGIPMVLAAVNALQSSVVGVFEEDLERGLQSIYQELYRA